MNKKENIFLFVVTEVLFFYMFYLVISDFLNKNLKIYEIISFSLIFLFIIPFINYYIYLAFKNKINQKKYYIFSCVFIEIFLLFLLDSLLTSILNNNISIDNLIFFSISLFTLILWTTYNHYLAIKDKLNIKKVNISIYIYLELCLFFSLYKLIKFIINNKLEINEIVLMGLFLLVSIPGLAVTLYLYINDRIDL